MNTTEELIGATLDEKYRVDRLIGRGGMGAVYAGTHVALDRKVAIKVLKPEFLADANAMSRFAREARAAARVEHPNAVGVYDFGALEGGAAYLVMEYVDGRSLRDLMREQGRFSVAAAFSLSAQAAAAVGAAHARGVIHRDLKPENMMVRFDDEGVPTLKVVDFGIAKLLSSDVLTQVTGPAELVGTPKYMAPEQFTGDEVDGRVDVYALGVVLYEMLAGRAPFEGTLSEIIGKHLYAKPASFESLAADVPAEVEDVVAHALAKNPAERLPSASALVLELAEACGDEVIGSKRLFVDLPNSRPLASSQALTYGGETPSMVATIAGSHDSIALAARSTPEPADFVTKHIERDDADVDLLTRVRRVGIPTVVMPAMLSKLVRPSGPIARARRTVIDLERPIRTAPKRWYAPATVGLAAILALGSTAWLASDAPTDASAEVSAASTTLPESAFEPLAGAGAGAELVDGKTLHRKSEEPKAVASNRKTRGLGKTSKAGRSNDRAAVARSQSRRSSGGSGPNPLRAIGRAMRIDRQFRKLF